MFLIFGTYPQMLKLGIGAKRRLDIKGGKFSYRRLGPYSVKALDKNGLAPLESLKGIVLKQKYNCALLKP